MNQYILLVVSWTVYFFLHSFLAAEKIKDFFVRKLGKRTYIFRFFYVLISIVGLFGMLLLNSSIPSESILPKNSVTRFTSYVLAAFGVIIIRVAFRQYDFKGFLGLRNEKTELKEDGILGRVRHPIYSGLILMIVGYWFFSPDFPTLISVICNFIYLAIGIYLEEKKLVRMFGEKYIEYRRRVPMLIPKV